MRSPFRAVSAGLAGALAAGALASCAPASEEAAEPRTLILAVDSLQAEWDPLQGAFMLQADPQSLAVYDSLLEWDGTTESGEPSLAEEVTYSDDRRLITIRLRDDVDFSDGTHMDAAGVERYLEALMASDYVLNGSLLPYGPEIETVGEYTLEVSTEQPVYAADFGRALFSWTPILSPAAIDDPELARTEPLGSGPYRVESVSPEVEITFVRNPDYWNADAFPFERLVLKVIADQTARLNALKSGQVTAARISPLEAPEVEEAGFTVYERKFQYTSLNVWDPANSANPALRDTRVRQAIALAFDQQAIADTVFGGYATTGNQIFKEGQPQYVEGGDDRFAYDPERATELLAEAGYPDGFELTIAVDGSTADLQPIVQQSLADIGIRVTYANLGADYGTGVMGGQHAAFLISDSYGNTLRLPEVFPGLGQVLVATQEVLDWITEIKGVDGEASARASQELGEFMLEEQWVIPIVHPSGLWATAPEVEILHTDRLRGTSGYPYLRDFAIAE